LAYLLILGLRLAWLAIIVSGLGLVSVSGISKNNFGLFWFWLGLFWFQFLAWFWICGYLTIKKLDRLLLKMLKWIYQNGKDSVAKNTERSFLTT